MLRLIFNNLLFVILLTSISYSQSHLNLEASGFTGTATDGFTAEYPYRCQITAIDNNGYCTFGGYLIYLYRIWVYVNNNLVASTPDFISQNWDCVIDFEGREYCEVKIVWQLYNAGCLGEGDAQMRVEDGRWMGRKEELVKNTQYPNSNTTYEFYLKQNYPNPFNPRTSIEYSIPNEDFVNLSIYNMLGEKVFTLVNSLQEAGDHEVVFNSNGLSSGFYVYRICTNKFSSSKKMIISK